MLKPINLPPAARAMLATFAAASGLTLSGNETLDVVIVAGWFLGGIVEIVRDYRAQRNLTPEQASQRLQDAADAFRRGGPTLLVLLALGTSFLAACGGSELTVRSVRADCEAEVIFERDSIPIGVLVRPSISEGSDVTRSALVCVSFGLLIVCEELLQEED